MKVREAMQGNVPTVDGQDTLAHAQQLMRWGELHALPVVGERKRCVGLLSEHDLLCAVTLHGAAEGLQRSVRDFMSVLTEFAAPDADLAGTAEHMARERLDCLAVCDGETFVGLLLASDALEALVRSAPAKLEAVRPGAVPVSTIMYPEPIAVRRHATLLATAARMAERGVRHACVVDSEQRVIGVLSDRDVRRLIGHPKLALTPNRVPEHLHRLLAEQVMSTPTTVSQDASIDEALTLLLSGRWSALPVTDSRG